jgi:hypothetical protein
MRYHVFSVAVVATAIQNNVSDVRKRKNSGNVFTTQTKIYPSISMSEEFFFLSPSAFQCSLTDDFLKRSENLKNLFFNWITASYSY